MYTSVTEKGLLCLSMYLQTLMFTFSKAASEEWIYLFSLLVIGVFTVSV